MLRVIIIEDEKAALEQVISTLNEVSPSANIVATASSVTEGISCIREYPDTDIIFSDVQLSDGLSFDIFNETGTKIPVVFITGYDHFMMNAFEHNGIDYLLKPVSTAELSKSILKYQAFEKHFGGEDGGVQRFTKHFHLKKKCRILVKKGLENVSLRLSDIAMFYTEQKIVYCIARDGRKYLCDKNLTDLEEDLDPEMFFRVNRQYIINIDYIKSYKTFEKVKLKIDLVIEVSQHQIIVSQETAPVFRKWIVNN